MKNVEPNYEKSIVNIYKNEYKSMVSYAFSICGKRSLAEDIIQDIFLSILQRKKFVKPVKLNEYIYSSIKKNAFMKLRNLKRRKEILSEINNQRTSVLRCCQVSNDFLNESRLNGFIDQLPNRRKTVFIMKKVEKRSIKEISNTLLISKKTVENHITYAVRDLKAKINSN